MNIITTSRKPGTNARLFAKELAPIVNAVYMTRGKASISDLITNARYHGAKNVFVVTEYAGNPHQILEIKIEAKSWAFNNTFFVSLHKLRKTLTKEKYIIKEINYNTNIKAMRDLLRDAEVESYENADFELRDLDEVVSLFYKDKEIGPRFKIFYK